MSQLIHDTAAIGDHSATFAFAPVGNAHTQILLQKVTRADGSVRWVRHQEIGPFGNTSLDAQGIEAMNPAWQDIAKQMAGEAYRCIACLEGNAPNYWQGNIIDMTHATHDDPKPVPTPTPESNGGDNDQSEEK